jgi:hypothetical protein
MQLKRSSCSKINCRNEAVGDWDLAKEVTALPCDKLNRVESVNFISGREI